MAIAFACQGCGKRYQVDESLAGKRGQCKKCGQTFQIPTPRARAAAGPSWAEDLDQLEEAGPAPAPRAEARKNDAFSLDYFERNGWKFLPGIAVGVTVYCLIVPNGRDMAIGYTAVFGLILAGIGIAGIIKRAFQEDRSAGMRCLIPGYGLYYVAGHWATTKRFFLLGLGGFALLAPLVVVVPLLRDPIDAVNLAAAEADSPHERSLKELIASLREQADMLDSIHDADSARDVLPKMEGPLSRSNDLVLRPFPKSPPDETRRLKETYDPPLKAAMTRLLASAKGATTRFRNAAVRLPGLHWHFDMSPDTDAFFVAKEPPPPPVVARPLPNPNPNMPVFAPPTFRPPGFAGNRPPGPPPGFVPPSQPPKAEGPSATFHVTGRATGEEATWKAIQRELDAIAKELAKDGGRGVGYSYSNGKLTFRVTPVHDPRAFADRVKFGRVTRVEGDQIDVVIE